ncbi:hypothetical protein GE300_07330 [Rhodobacteraceae bacterium 2CG4]|uniref:HTH luxR-type domain-containing protein n=1 Tax=Halovulum marinum TaxID=2662447 RepID=A0A6L5YYR5_9RHOB|nr:LuxR family transcriptional regulator [Halovulum marinum]MSU89426.1 hypothetical protein [Halovulum marinum]
MSQSIGVGTSCRLDGFLESCAKATWTEPLWYAAIEFFRSQGFTSICYQHLPPLGAPDEDKIRVAASGYDEAWSRRYIAEKMYRTDPIPAQAVSAEEPFRWGDIRKLREMTKPELRILELLESRGGDGLAIPAFGPGGRNGYFGLGLSDPERSIGRAEMSRHQLACQAAHLRYCRLLRQNLPEMPLLSTRERELLGWVARGKSNNVIAEIMQISPHTVDAYLRRVFYKLGTTDRISAVVKAIGSGLIRGY